MNKTIRLYGDILEKWLQENENGRQILVQVEKSYKEFDLNGFLVNVGSEDFTPERLNQEVDEKFIYTWDGEKRNNGGYRQFECKGLIHFRKSERKLVREYLVNKYNAEKVELR